MKTERNLEQETKIEQFLSFYYSFREWDKTGNTIGAVAIDVIMVGLMGIPVQNFLQNGFDKEDFFLISIFFLMNIVAFLLYMKSYNCFQENQQLCAFYDKLKYLPIDKKVLRNIKVRYMLRFESKVFLAALAMQLLFAAILYHCISWENIVYVVVVVFVLPVLLEIWDIWSKDRV